MRYLKTLACVLTFLLCAPLAAQKMDVTASTIDSYKNGTVKASYFVQVHKDPEAGQYWETSMEMAGDMTMTTRWQVVKVDGNTAIVENQMKMDSEYMVSNYVIAYKVDLDKDVGSANVTKAWIGKPGEKGAEIKVMEAPKSTGGKEEGAEDPNLTKENFEGLELAGGTWSGTVYIFKYEGGESKTWMADNGWFGGMVKMESGGTTTKLVAFGKDAKALLKWEDAKEAKEAKEAKDGEKSDEEKKGPATGEKKEPAKDEKKDEKKEE